VQVTAEPADPMMDALRRVLDPWLGQPTWRQTEGRVTSLYSFESEEAPPVTLRLKVEINSRELLSTAFALLRFGPETLHCKQDKQEQKLN
jgi:hypothetical protein